MTAWLRLADRIMTLNHMTGTSLAVSASVCACLCVRVRVCVRVCVNAAVLHGCRQYTGGVRCVCWRRARRADDFH